MCVCVCACVLWQLDTKNRWWGHSSWLLQESDHWWSREDACRSGKCIQQWQWSRNYLHFFLQDCNQNLKSRLLKLTFHFSHSQYVLAFCVVLFNIFFRQSLEALKLPGRRCSQGKRSTLLRLLNRFQLFAVYLLTFDLKGHSVYTCGSHCQTGALTELH